MERVFDRQTAAIAIIGRNTVHQLSALLLSLLLAGCKIGIEVPAGGHVADANGAVCLAGEVCEINVSSTDFSRTFTAVPADGYRFTGWKKAQGYLCGGSSAPCVLSTSGFAGMPALQALLASDALFPLVPTFEAESTRYNRAEWRALLTELNSPRHRSNNYLYRLMPDAGNCDPGALSTAAEERFLHTVNLIRKLHHLPALDYASGFASEAQQSALVQLANNTLSHRPVPADRCYSAAAAAGAGSSNLGYRSIQSDPAYYALAWTNDNHNLANLMEAGHRRWMLYPALGHTSYGQAQGYASMKVFGFHQPPPEPVSAELEFVAMPYADYPYAMLTRGSSPTPWSLSMVPPQGVSSRFDYFADASVSVRETGTGSALAVHSLHRDSRGFGLANFLSWMVDGWEYDTHYTVTIGPVRMQDSSLRTIEYGVKIDFAALQ